jgi:hypothetical protein
MASVATTIQENNYGFNNTDTEKRVYGVCRVCVGWCLDHAQQGSLCGQTGTECECGDPLALVLLHLGDALQHEHECGGGAVADLRECVEAGLALALFDPEGIDDGLKDQRTARMNSKVRVLGVDRTSVGLGPPLQQLISEALDAGVDLGGNALVEVDDQPVRAECPAHVVQSVGDNR